MILSLFLFFSSLTLVGQSAVKIDSLKKLINSEIGDSLKAETFNELSWEYRIIDKKSATNYGLRALALSKNAGLKSVQATSLNRLGEIQRLQRQWDQAINYFHEALQIERSIHNDYGIGRALGQLTTISNSKGEYDSALIYGVETIELFQKIKNERSEARAHQRLAIAHLKKGNYSKALTSAENVLKISENNQFDILTGGAYSILGEIYTVLGLYEKATSLYNSSIRIWQSYKDNRRLADDYLNIGYVYILSDSLNKADEFTRKSLKIREINKLPLQDTNYNNLGLIAERQENLDSATFYYEQSLQLKLQDTNHQSIATGYYNLGQVNIKKGDFNMALKNLNSALESAENYGYPKLLRKIYWQLVQANFELGNQSLSKQFLAKYKAASNAIDRTKISTLQATDAYEESKISLEISAYESKIKQAEIINQNIIIYSLCAVILFLSIIFFYLFRNHQLKKDKVIADKNYEINERKIKNLLQSQELSSFSSMIEVQEKERNRIARDLHDRLGGMLSMVKLHFKSVEEEIKNLRQKNVAQYSKANDLLDEACEEVRKIAHDMTSGILMNFGLVPALQDLKKTIELTEELKIDLVSLGLDERLDFDYEINLYRIIQELISNTLKHAHANEIHIQIYKRNEQINLVYEDNGVGFSTKDEKVKTGMGLKNINARVYKLNGELIIDSGKGGGTTITIDLPLKLHP